MVPSNKVSPSESFQSVNNDPQLQQQQLQQPSSDSPVPVQQLSARPIEKTHVVPKSFKVERDYSLQDITQFQTSPDQIPTDLLLNSQLSTSQITSTIEYINQIYLSAESPNLVNVAEGFLALLTCHLSYCFYTPITHYHKKMLELDGYLALRNREVFQPAGFRISAPRHFGNLYVSLKVCFYGTNK